jgi:hypothetical protein
MTEKEWLKSNDAIAMLQFLKGKKVATPRKLCLFTCARLRGLLSDQPPVLALIEIAEQFVEGPVSIEERRSALAKFKTIQDLRTPILDLRSLRLNLVRHCLTVSLAGYGAEMEWWHYATGAATCSKAEPEAARQAATLLRETFLTPLIRRVPRIPPSWLTTNVVSLGQAIYDQRAFDQMPILADALEDAGCTNEEVLAHARGEGPHVRGCWLIDLLLDKE